MQIPGYIEHSDALKAAGVEEVITYCVNDGAVMKAWAADQKIEGSVLTFMADPYSDLTNGLDLQLTHEGPIGKGLTNRCKRSALYLEDGVVKAIQVSEKPDDPAGDDFPETSCAPNMLKVIASLKSEL